PAVAPRREAPVTLTSARTRRRLFVVGIRVAFAAMIGLVGAVAYGQATTAVNPYSAEGEVQARSQTATLDELRRWVGDLVKTASSAVEFCMAATLYKRLGDARAAEYYEKATEKDRDEPAYELLYGIYLRLYRGAGIKPLFPAAEQHLQAARAKL